MTGRRATRPGHAGQGVGVRRVLYMATLTATCPPSRALCARLLARGGLPKIALVACTRKRLTSSNAIVRDGTPCNPALHNP